ncbi:hypothetical protein [Paracoccus homiensis]|uniref:Uncharacterized protein n=1 Tax=Paracoccus homiensis TaxID=364199 RepID=A0A1I0J098_9RHOB|nr:hypothetical protein [Paracoccus homiensis]SEU03078.1 hypothetical protein SAMN04489858_12052 [Paracoccus homiensis]
MKADKFEVTVDFEDEIKLFQRMDDVLASIEQRLDRIQGMEHGGIKIFIAGSLANVEISPSGNVNGDQSE